MPQATVGNTTFFRGQIDPALYGRIDTELYRDGVKEMTNFRVTAGGSVKRRPGTELVAVAAGGTGRIVPFEMTSDERYIMHFYASNIKIYNESGTNVATLSTPYSAAEVWELDYAQSVSRMILTHEDHKPRVVTRTAADTFSIAEISWDEQVINGQRSRVFEPFYQYSGLTQYFEPQSTGATGVTLNIENSSGTNYSYFTGTLSDWVGVRFRYQKNQQFVITAAGSSSSVTANHEGDGLTEVPFPSADPGQTVPGTKRIILSWPFHGLIDNDQIQIGGWGDGVSGIGTTIGTMNTTHNIKVLNRDQFEVTHTNNNATTNQVGGGTRVFLEFDGTPNPVRTSWFDESAYSAVRGWPNRCCFYEQRLVFGAGSSIPDTVYMSRSGSPFNFDTGDGEAADAIAVSLGASEIQLVTWLVPGRNFVVLSEAAEFHFPQDNDSGPLTPSNARAQRGTTYGSSADCKPVILEGAVVFAQENGKSVRQYSYAPNQFGVYESPSLSVLASDLIDTPRQFAVTHGSASGGENYLFVLNNGATLGGQLAVFSQNKDQNVAGWFKWNTQKDNTPTDGSVTSICALGPDLYLLVERDSGTGGDQYQIEKLSTTSNWYVDGGIEDTGVVSGNSFGGFTEYNGQTVSVCDLDTGAYLGEFAVTAGEIDVGEAGHSNIVAGFNYTATLELLPPELQVETGVTVGEYKGIFRSVIRVDGTHNFSTEGGDITISDDASSLPYTGIVELHHDGYGTDETLSITQTVPEPLHILAAHYEVDW